MVNFATPTQVLQYLSGASEPRLDEPGDTPFSASTLNTRLSAVSSRLRNRARVLGYDLPTEEEATNRWYLLELLNVELVAAQTIRALSGVVDPLLSRQANKQIAFAEGRLRLFELDRLRLAFQGTLPATALCSVSDVTIEIPGTPKTPTPIIERFILRESALVRAIIALWGVMNDPEDEDDLELVKDLTAKTVRAYVLRRESSAQYGPSLDSTVNALLDEAGAQLGLISNGSIRMAVA